ncbi:MAG: hypothetical protein HOQ02_08405 [Lysobacter sp.]|nr:hypothetical protein [Lysobacter sp.]
MSETGPTPAPPSAPASPARQGKGLAYAVIVVFLLALAFGAWGLWRVFAPAPGDARPQLRVQQARIGTLEQQVATLARSDQISRDANRDLQRTLAERDEEIAGLRADLAFYERFVAGTAPRHGLGVQALQLQNEGGRAWHFAATLTQTATRDAVNQGRLTLSVEGSRGGRMQHLDWAALRQQPNAPGVAYAFKYFQQVEGDVLLPPGLQPIRVTAHLQPDAGEAVEQSFTWRDAASAPAADGRR